MKNEYLSAIKIWKIAVFSDTFCKLTPGELFYENCRFCFSL